MKSEKLGIRFKSNGKVYTLWAEGRLVREALARQGERRSPAREYEAGQGWLLEKIISKQRSESLNEKFPVFCFDLVDE
ncbi:MAG: hypothetical protein WA063_05000 [Minisyncoccia bacterium]